MSKEDGQSEGVSIVCQIVTSKQLWWWGRGCVNKKREQGKRRRDTSLPEYSPIEQELPPEKGWIAVLGITIDILGPSTPWDIEWWQVIVEKVNVG